MQNIAAVKTLPSAWYCGSAVILFFLLWLSSLIAHIVYYNNHALLMWTERANVNNIFVTYINTIQFI